MNWALLAVRIVGALAVVAAALVALVLFLTTSFGPAEPGDPLYQQLAALVRAAPISRAKLVSMDLSDQICPLVDTAKLERLAALTANVRKGRGDSGYAIEIAPWPVQNCFFPASYRRVLEVWPGGGTSLCHAAAFVPPTCDP